MSQFWFTSLLALCSAAASLIVPSELSNLITPETQLVRRQTLTTNATGTIGSNYYSLWDQADAGVTMNLNYGQYRLSWSSVSERFIGGMGWVTGSNRLVVFSGEFNPSGNAYFSVYGWTTDPLVEYYICEAFGTYNPGTGLTHMGTLSSDQGTYDIYQTVRTNASSILGTQTFKQFWSVRQSTRTSGVVTTANHFNAWASLGMAMGTFNYQIIATEGHQGSGSSFAEVY
ncbi:hypothetical protein GALMADRAFT_779852 [Galerina marginata CBS 339.88]|uniref:Endo-1,4-beta-xylanase n=1 Tax=Galerina marginata (strain CBS 339.88) TaxID=685588 RepID=A0A067SYD9_GALM3|nr:hypothetical protein GALMADRAFT_779852 [Galerina marginata CBS 339.88]